MKTITIIPLLYISTNIDDLFLLHARFSKKISWITILLGQIIIGLGILVGVSFLFAQGILYVSGDTMKRLSLGGIIPIVLIVLGIYEIYWSC